MKGSIKGWEFPRFFSADGSESSTAENLTADKKKLEARLIEIPKQISALQSAISSMQSDYDWLSSLNKRRQKKYEKENGRHPHEIAFDLKNKIAAANASISSLNTEKSRIPAQLEALQKQIDTLIKGESEGLAKGLDKESAKVLGEFELKKEQAKLEHETELQKIETEKAEQLAQKEVEEKKADNNNKLFIGIGIAVVVLIIGYMIYRSRMAVKASKVNIQPLAT